MKVPGPLAQLAWLVVRELWAEWRGREALAAAGLFALVQLLVFGFALDPVAHDLAPLFPGLATTVLAFTGVLVLQRSFAREREAGGYEQLAVLPVDRSLVLYAKACGGFILLLAVQVVALPLLAVLLRFERPLAWGPFLGALLLASAGFALAGTLVGAIAAPARAAAALLPVLLLPLVLPLVLGVVRIGLGLLEGLPTAQLAPWFRLLAGYDMVLSVVPLVAADALLES